MGKIAATLALSVSLAALAGPAAVAAPRWSGDHDTTRCVTTREVSTLRKLAPRDEVERRWEVRGKGTRIDDPVVGRVWAYPLCGSTGIDYAFAYAQENRAGLIAAVGTYDCGCDPADEPTPAPGPAPTGDPFVVSLRLAG